MAKNAKPSESKLKDWQKQALTHAGIILAFFLLVVAYFSPLVFSNKMVDWHDIVQFQGMARETVDFRNETGEEALWVSTIFSGMPAFQTSVRYSGNFFTSINKLFWLGLPRPANYVFLYFLGFYFLLATMRIRPLLSGIGAAAFALSSYFFIILVAGHTSKANAIAYMAPVIAGILMAYRGKYLLGGIVTAFFLALELTANHYQITYYLAMIVGLLGIVFLVDAIRNQQIPHFAKASGILLGAALLAVGPNLGRILTTMEYAQETMRGKPVLQSAEGEAKSGLDKEYAFRYSYGISETFTLLIPDFHGGASATKVEDRELERRFQTSDLRLPTYWGDQPPTSGPVYVGAIICFLFVLGLFLVDGKIKWWIVASSVLFLLLSWGRHLAGFNYFIFDYFPAYNKFRAVSMCLVILEFTMPLLAVMGLSRLFEMKENGKPDNKVNMALYISAGVTGGLALLFALIGPALFSFEKASDSQQYAQILDILRDVRISMFRADAFRAFGFVAAAAALIWLYLRGTLKENIVIGGLALLVVLDLLPVANRYLNSGNYISERQYENKFTPSAADNFILQDKDPNFRVFNFAASQGPFNDAMTSYFHKSVGGYHAAKLRRYQDMIDRHISREMQELGSLLQSQLNDSTFRAGMARLEIFNMLNTRYFMFDPNQRPLQNPAALGNAWFVREVKFVNSPDEEIAALNGFNPSSTVIVDQNIDNGRFKQQLEGFTASANTSGRITLTEFKPNHLTYQSSSPVEAVGVFSEVYYNHEKGWKAYIDGTETPHFRADYILRGLRIPAGDHKIEFKFEPSSFYFGNRIAMVASILLILGLIGILYLEYRPKKED